MVYLAGDNNLEEPALKDLNEMELAGSTGQVNVLVEIDRAEGYSGRWQLDGRTPLPCRTRRRHAQHLLPRFADLGEVDSGSTETYIDFVNWGVENFPAEQYALIIWNHGWGWTIGTHQRSEGRVVGR